MQPRRKETRLVRKAFYRLKRDYGFPIRLYKITNVTLDLEAGTKTRRVRYKSIPRAVFVTAKLYRSFVYDLSYIAVNKNFVSGGFFDPEDRVILIDWQDTRDFIIKIDDYIVYDNKHYLITGVRTFENDAGYLVKVRGVAGSELIDVALFEISNAIEITQTVAADAIP
ncbi:hypothetical protein LCGC14_1329110 [marine sediment metagenome]|uniref:Uncharacterized protein n=1 Tax=marine sediment metagenome TaxID=412755 RepID=A0A0F9NJM9_9ZZZZ